MFIGFGEFGLMATGLAELGLGLGLVLMDLGWAKDSQAMVNTAAHVTDRRCAAYPPARADVVRQVRTAASA